MKRCTVGNCTRPYKTAGYCGTHYLRLWRGKLVGGAEALIDRDNPKEDHPLYAVWKNMRQRCNNSNCPAFKWYGARGIKVCERWDSFRLFVIDMGKKPTSSHSIDRINNDGDYTPENCRWATKKEQSNNRRRVAAWTF